MQSPLVLTLLTADFRIDGKITVCSIILIISTLIPAMPILSGRDSFIFFFIGLQKKSYNAETITIDRRYYMGHYILYCILALAI